MEPFALYNQSYKIIHVRGTFFSALSVTKRFYYTETVKLYEVDSSGDIIEKFMLMSIICTDKQTLMYWTLMMMQKYNFVILFLDYLLYFYSKVKNIR